MEEIGALLRRAREEKQLSIEDVAEITKIRKSYLIAIEEGDTGSLPDDVYLRAFLRTYAKVVGVDLDQVMQAANEELEKEEPPVPKVSLLEKRRAKRRKKRIRFAVIMCILLVALVVYYCFFR